MDYERREDDSQDFCNTIKKAKDTCELYAEKRLVKRGNAGDIFNAKQYGFTDKQEIDLNHSGKVDLGGVFSDSENKS